MWLCCVCAEWVCNPPEHVRANFLFSSTCVLYIYRTAFSSGNANLFDLSLYYLFSTNRTWSIVIRKRTSNKIGNLPRKGKTRPQGRITNCGTPFHNGPLELIANNPTDWMSSKESYLFGHWLELLGGETKKPQRIAAWGVLISNIPFHSIPNQSFERNRRTAVNK